MISPIKINTLLKEHGKIQYPKALNSCLGDSYLLKYNPIYRSIREDYTRRGFKFSKDDFCHAQSTPLLALPHYLNERKIVLVDNITPLKKLNTFSPGTMSFDDIYEATAMRNFLLHESSHCIAHDIFFKKMKVNRHVKKTQENVLLFLLCEAFANTVETFGGLYANTPVHTAFYDLGSYRAVKYMPTQNTRECLKSIGPSNTFRLMIFGFLCDNFSYDNYGKPHAPSNLEITGVPNDVIQKNKKIVDGMIKECHVNLTFRMKTTPMYFRLLGFKKHFMKITEFNFVKALESVPNINEKLFQLERAILTHYYHPTLRH